MSISKASNVQLFKYKWIQKLKPIITNSFQTVNNLSMNIHSSMDTSHLIQPQISRKKNIPSRIKVQILQPVPPTDNKPPAFTPVWAWVWESTQTSLTLMRFNEKRNRFELSAFFSYLETQFFNHLKYFSYDGKRFYHLFFFKIVARFMLETSSWRDPNWVDHILRTF